MGDIQIISIQKRNDDESHKADAERIIAITKSQGLVPIGRTFGSDVRVMFAPKQLVDSGADQQTLLANSIHVKISMDMFDYFKIYKPSEEKSSDVESSNKMKTVVDEGKPVLNGTINRLVMIERSRCMICDKQSYSPVTTVFLDNLSGWVACPNCIEKGWLREEICIALNKNLILPIRFLFEEKFRGKWLFKINGADYVVLKFWRKSQQAVYISMMTKNDTLHSRKSSSGDNVINLQFIDHGMSDNPTESRTTVLSQESIENINSIKIAEPFLTRGVSLKNILYYNPGLLEDIFAAQTLFEQKFPANISISLADLPDLKKNLEEYAKDANQSDGKFDQ